MGTGFGYDGKSVVVTGGFSGVGESLVELLAELNAERITVLDVKEPPGPATEFIETDLSDPGAVDAALARLGGTRVDALFNNAGVAANLGADPVMAINFLALRRLSTALLDQIPAGGAIVNTASIAGGQWARRLTEITELVRTEGWDDAAAWIRAHPELVADPYAFSKECVQVWTMRSSRATGARGVRTNSVCPAPVDTPLLPDFRDTMSPAVVDWTVEQAAGRLATSREIANALAFLGADAASYVNGVNLLVDAGFGAAMTTGQVDFSGLG